MRKALSRLLGVFLATLLLHASPVTAADGSTCDIETTDRIVAIGDVHGAYDRFVAILKSAGLVDGRQRWSGGRAVLVQTGDVVDRGADSRRVLDLLRRLENEASRAGGRVVALLGNHEVMNMIGDLSYVSAGEYAAFRTPESTELRDRFYELASDNARKRASAAGQAFDDTAFRKQFYELTPLGSVELQIAFAPRGQYGSWLRDRAAMAMVNGIAFVHGGISSAIAAMGCAGINKAISAELSPPTDVRLARTPAEQLSTREDGPFWYRGLALDDERQTEAAVATILQQLDAKAIVIGHTVTDTRRIATRYAGHLIQLDTGMLGGSFFPGGRASAVEIRGGRITAVYEDGRQELMAFPPPGLPAPSASVPDRSPATAR